MMNTPQQVIPTISTSTRTTVTEANNYHSSSNSISSPTTYNTDDNNDDNNEEIINLSKESLGIKEEKEEESIDELHAPNKHGESESRVIKPKNPWIKTSSPTSLPSPSSSSFKTTTNDNNNQHVAVSFQSIMEQQEYEKRQSFKKVSIIDIKEMDEEEKMIRLAIEASLKDQNISLGVVDFSNEAAEAAGSSLNDTTDYYFHSYNYDAATVAAVAGNEEDDQKFDVDDGYNNNDNDNNNNSDNDDEGSMDEDMKLAIRLSLQESQQPQHVVMNEIYLNNHSEQDIKPSHLTIQTSDNYDDDEEEIDQDDDNDTSFAKKLSHGFESNNTKMNSSVAASTSASASIIDANATTSFLTKEEEEEIAKAIMDADDVDMAKSIQLAMKLNEEEEQKLNQYHSITSSSRQQGQLLGNNVSNVRLVSQYEYDDFKSGRSKNEYDCDNERQLWGKDDYELHHHYYGNDTRYDTHYDDETAGFQMNSSIPSKWSRLDKNTIIGPNNEIRTKHDISLKNQVNAEKLLSSTSSTKPQKCGGNVSVSDVAYNSFHRSLKTAMKRSTVKGVAAHGTGRAENMNAEKTRGGAMDGNVRLLISKAITNGLIQYCNGVVKEGKEAIVYHADGNINADSESGGFDVAVKVFKRIQEFKGRGAYIDGDPRYFGKKFSNVDNREQVELWTEKEYRNLIRANRAGVPVPTPLVQKENVLFMRFLGKDCWPAPQLREIELKKGSKKWTGKYMSI